MATARDVVVLVGSLRAASLTRRVANALGEVAPPSLALSQVEYRDLALYDQDLEDRGAPPEWIAFRDRVRRADAMLFVTPEYNRSVPGGLKNAIDVGSRPSGQSVFDGKPAGVVSVSPGALAAFGANHHLRQMLVFLNMPAMAMPEAYIGGVKQKLDDAGKLVDDGTRQFLTKFMDAFAQWVEQTRRKG
ncbi:MAG: NADPH-dependent FMN reductase [Gemmatimonadaceae bacterium]